MIPAYIAAIAALGGSLEEIGRALRNFIEFVEKLGLPGIGLMRREASIFRDEVRELRDAAVAVDIRSDNAPLEIEKLTHRVGMLTKRSGLWIRAMETRHKIRHPHRHFSRSTGR